ncbi:MAG: S1 RNA-binding domain-containing protein [Deltaproteobacteria bacterium]|nr:S1 RNA-binding domain-containing protein [Kofleriaceae bacterium]
MPTDENEDFAAMFAEAEAAKPKGKAARRPKPGDVVRGVVTTVGKDAVFVDLGGKAEGVLDREQVIDGEGNLRVKVGDTIEARVAGERGGSLVLRVKLGKGPEARAELVQALELGIPVEGKVTQPVKGGLEVDVAGVRGFVPASQVDARFVEDLTPFVGQRLEFRVTQYERGNLVLSRRALLEEENARRAAETRAKLVVGAVIRGRVTGFKPFGAFVDIGGIEGMLHVSELGFSRVETPEEVLALGQELDVSILKIEEGEPGRDGQRRPRIGLSLKALQADPWLEATRQLTPGGRVRGTITRLQPFGAFVEIAPGVEGLVHISELGAGRRLNHPKEAVAVGQAVEVEILAIDPDKRRLSLSMSAAQRTAEREQLDEARASVPQAPAKLGTFADLLKKK